jgi:GT2 family glycosyltransferase
MKNLAIIIPTFNRKLYLFNLLNQITTMIHSNFCIDIIVVVDGSKDGTIEMISENFDQVHIVKGTGEWWYTKSINKGFDYVKKLNTDYVLTLNDDILLKNNFFEALNEAIEEGPENSIIGALSLTNTNPKKILSAGIKKIILWRYKLIPYYKMFTNKNEVSSLKGLHVTMALPGRGMLIPFGIFKKLKGFDEKFMQYHSDFDFCLRAKKKGYNLFISWEVIVYSFIEETGEGTSYLKTSFSTFVSSFFKKQSRINLKDNARYLFRHGNKLLFPLTYLIFLMSCFNAHFFKKKING